MRPSVAEVLFAGIRNQGCLPTRQIIKATLDHCNPGPLAAAVPAKGQKQGGFFRFQAQVIATIFAGVLPWRGNRLREGNGRDVPCRLFVSKQAGPAQPGLWFKKVLLGADGFKRNHGKVRIKPRHNGCGRNRHCAESAAGGHSIIRHAHIFRRTAAGFAAPAAAVCCRQETK